MPTPRVQAAAEGMPETSDPIVSAAARLQTARIRYEELEAVSSAAHRSNDYSKKRWFESASMEVLDEVDTLRLMLSLDRATTLPGALIQIGEAIARLDLLMDQFPDPEFRTRQDARVLNRILYSVLSVLIDASARKSNELIDDDFFNLHLDPWAPVEARFVQTSPEAGR